MAKGRTISASFLTELDKKVLEICNQISEILLQSITDKEEKKKFKNEFAKIHKSRDAATGLGGGKLQRDALCTRGIQGLAPFSNRNLRWHPLVVSQKSIPFAKTIERIEIENTTLIFVVKDKQGNEQNYNADKAHELPERYTVLPEHWFPHIDTLKFWGEVEWTQNSCVITAYEACNWYDAVEAYAILGISIVVGEYGVNFENIYTEIIEILKNQQIDSTEKLPSAAFPKNKIDIISCPLCKVPTSKNVIYKLAA